MRFTVFPKLLLSFLFILAPLYVISIFMINYGSDYVRQQITYSMQERLNAFNSELENNVSRMIAMMKELSTYEELDRLANMDEVLTVYEKNSSIRHVQKELSVIRSTSSFVSNASVHIPALNRTVDINLYDELRQDEYEALHQVNNIYETPIVSWKSGLYISLAYPSFLGPAPPHYIISIELSREMLMSALSKLSSGGEVILLSERKGWRISEGQPLVSESFSGVREIDAGVQELKFGGQTYIAAYQNSAMMGTTLMLVEKEQNILGPLQQFRVWYWRFSAIAILILVLAAYLIYKLIHSPTRKLVHGFRMVEQGKLDVVVPFRSSDEFGYLITQFNRMVRKLQETIVEVYEQKISTQHAELKQLQSQINPHFLYNSLFILYRLAKKSEDEVQMAFTQHLSDYFQFITRTNAEEVTLLEEVKHVTSYIEIQSIRFAGQIRVEMQEIPEPLRQFPVPRLILQPIVENAYKYALENRVGGGRLQITYEEADELLRIHVEDNGDSLTDQNISMLRGRLLDTGQSALETTGVMNVHQRLRIRYGADSGLAVERSALGGLKVTIQIFVGGSNV
ncbi:sensor histidine kinase [Cohnella soli]|uniref:Sensor histidine kinase n=1 Tax=Cohnella soli TaxID=425005 RepID=A0ABW0HU50_9BACL